MIRRERVFGPRHPVPLGHKEKSRIATYARVWSARNRQPGDRRRSAAQIAVSSRDRFDWSLATRERTPCASSASRDIEPGVAFIAVIKAVITPDHWLRKSLI